VRSAGVEVAGVVEGAVGGVLVVVALAIVAAQATRWWRARRRAREDPGVPALARFVDTVVSDPALFGGGALTARVVRRRDTVTYGYLAVAEEYVSEDALDPWCTLTVTLPGRVPFLVIDNRTATNRPGSPMPAAHRRLLDDPPFDANYVVGAADPEDVARILGPQARSVLIREPVQRLLLCDSQLQLRSFDAVTLDKAVIARLDGVAARFLSSTPSFVTVAGAVASPVPRHPGDPLPQGFYGPDAD
jgi:hypothetical protein